MREMRVTTSERRETSARSRIGEVAEQLNLPVATIRVWERRYGLPESARTEGGHRRFGPAEVEQLHWMLGEVSKGRPPREAAALLRRRTSDRRCPTYSFVRALLERHGDAEEPDVPRVLDAAAERLGPTRTIATVVAWTIRDLTAPGARPLPDLEERLRRWLRGVTGSRDRGTMLLTRTRDARAGLRLEAIGGLGRAQGWATQEIEAATNSPALTRALQGQPHAVVVLNAATAADRPAAAQLLRTASRTSSAGLFYTGIAFIAPTSRRHLPGTYLDDDVAAAADTLLRSLPSSDRA